MLPSPVSPSSTTTTTTTTTTATTTAQPIDHIERIERPSQAVIDAHVASGTPFVATGVVTEWPAYTRWRTPGYLVETVGAEHEVSVRVNTQRMGEGEWLGSALKLPFGEFHARYWHGSRDKAIDGGGGGGATSAAPSSSVYLASLPIKKHFPTLAGDIIVPRDARRQHKLGNLWLGNPGQLTPLHYDFSSGEPGMDGLHALVHGHKVFKLYDPAANVGLVPRRTVWGRFHQCPVDVEAPPPSPNDDDDSNIVDGADNALARQFAKARCIEVNLVAGEMLFIPKLWWHAVRTVLPTISVNFWWTALSSERLKLGKHWPVMREHVAAIRHMEISPQKLRGVLNYFGVDNATIDATVDISRWFDRGGCGSGASAGSSSNSAAGGDGADDDDAGCLPRDDVWRQLFCLDAALAELPAHELSAAGGVPRSSEKPKGKKKKKGKGKRGVRVGAGASSAVAATSTSADTAAGAVSRLAIYREHPVLLLALPGCLKTFTNGCRSPFFLEHLDDDGDDDGDGDDGSAALQRRVAEISQLTRDLHARIVALVQELLHDEWQVWRRRGM